VELYARVRRAVQVDRLSERRAAREFGISRETVRKMLRYSLPPGYSRQQPVRRPKPGAWIGIIGQTLEEDKTRPVKQRHTAKRIFERLRQDYAFAGEWEPYA
jgi:transposase